VTQRAWKGDRTLPASYYSFIDGVWVNCPEKFHVLNPASGEVLAEVTQCGAMDVQKAVSAAKACLSGMGSFRPGWTS